MMNYIKAEFFGLAKKVTAIHACVSMSGAFFYETKDAKIDILKLDRDRRVCSARSYANTLPSNVPATGSIVTPHPYANKLFCNIPRASQNPLRTLYPCTHICNYCFSCAVLFYCVRTPVAASAHDLAAHDQVEI